MSPSDSDYPVPLPKPLRDPLPILRDLQSQWEQQRADLWVFGYASLIWRPEFVAVERRPALVHGWHRAFRMKSRVNRGTPDNPGLVFALLAGGSCRGVIYRIPRARATAELERLWLREMPTGVYDPRWLNCHSAQGCLRALAFTLSRASPNHTGPIRDSEMLRILRQAQGRYGTTLDYLLETAEALKQHQVRDREVERLVVLAKRHGLA